MAVMAITILYVLNFILSFWYKTARLLFLLSLKASKSSRSNNFLSCKFSSSGFSEPSQITRISNSIFYFLRLYFQ